MPNTTRPTVYLEKNADGTTSVRVEETKLADFNADIEIHDRTYGPKPSAAAIRIGDTSPHVANGRTVDISNIDASKMYLGVSLKNTGKASIYDLKFDDFENKDIYGAVIRVGYTPTKTTVYNTTDITYIQRVEVDGKEAPLRSYSQSNRDFVSTEKYNQPVFIRDATAANLSDAAIDAKSSVYIMNATLDSAHRVIRAWQNVEIILVNCVIKSGAGHPAAWLMDATSSIKYYNTTWDGLDTIQASMISVENGNKALIRANNVVKLDHNPLEAMDDFFKSDVKEIHVEVSTNNGVWREIDIANNGEGRVAPIGDTLYDLPNLGGGTHQIRTWYLLEEGTKSEFSALQSMVGEGRVLTAAEQLGTPVINVDVQTGTDGKDVLFAHQNGTVFDGKAGHDWFWAGRGADKFIGGSGEDTVSYYTRTDAGVIVNLLDPSRNAGYAAGDTFDSIEVIRATNFDDRLTGDNSRQTFYAGNGNDVIYGLGGNDDIYAGKGNDTIFGGAGADRLYGDLGNDTFVFSRADLGNVDVIMDFTRRIDKIDLSAILDGYDSVTESIHDFLKITARGNDALISVDTEGRSHFTDLVVVKGQAALASANDLIAEQSIIV